MKFLVSWSLVLLFLYNDAFATESIVLKGLWKVKLDPTSVGAFEHWQYATYQDTITLPGTLGGAGYGVRTTAPDFGRLTPLYKYIGKAWYQRKVYIPHHWKEKQIKLLLERVLWESTVFIDGRKISRKDALGSPHLHELGCLTPGEHTLTICVNNEMMYNIGDKGHAYGEYTQTLWNGIIGSIELQAYDHTHIKSVNVSSDVKANTIKTEISIANFLPGQGELTLSLLDSEGRLLMKDTQPINSSVQAIEMRPPVKLEPWSEHSPTLYTIAVDLSVGKDRSSKQLRFGFREISRSKHHILLNGKPIFLRGNNDCGLFPLTGYPPTDTGEWKAIFRKYKAYGLNHVRFHSWCPPEAAFAAADELGIYIQAEASVWIDSWMEVDMEERGRKELSTKGKPQGLGKGDIDKDEFVKRELANIVDWYGNHPSLIMVCIGNELGSSDFDVVGEWINELKVRDPSRLYAASTARGITPYCDYAVTHDYPTLGQVRQRMYNHNNWDYEELFNQVSVPTIAHEIGQWPVHPVWQENRKYTGDLKAWNLEQLELLARQKGIHHLDSQFRSASGKLALLLYKDEIESYLRTPSAAGFQLLGMQDYSGQGEALIGWLDAFYDEKGVTTPKTFRQFCSEVVPLVKLSTYSWTSGQTIEAPLLLHQFSEEVISKPLRWYMADERGNILIDGYFERQSYERGQVHQVGSIMATIPENLAPCRLTLHVQVVGTDFTNSWSLWVFPEKKPDLVNDIYITNEFTEDTKAALSKGGKVLLIANDLGQAENTAFASWKPLYWSSTFFPGQGIQTIGLSIQNEHPLFRYFPTSNHSDWQWWNIAQGARGFLINDFPGDYLPIAMPISDFHFSDRIGSIFEVRVGAGSLLVCGYDISDANQTLEAKQLRYSMLRYMESDHFRPDVDVSLAQLTHLFQHSGSQKTTSSSVNNEALLSVLPDPQVEGESTYHPSLDQVVVGDTSLYKFKGVSYWKDGQSLGWKGNTIQLTIQVPQGFLGNLNLRFHSIPKECTVRFENRRYTLQHSSDEYNLLLPIMREDTQDGEIVMEIKGEDCPELIIKKIIVLPM